MNKNVVRLSFPVIIMLLLASCSPASQPLVTLSATITQPSAATSILTSSRTDTPSFTPSPTDTPMPTSSPTDAPTPTPSQPVFNLDTLGDNRELASFIMVFKYKHTGNGTVNESRQTIDYIKEPFSASEVNERNGYQLMDYWIGGQEYRNGGDGHWTIDLAADPDLLLNNADMRDNAGIYWLKSARFVSQEDFHGIPANHFEFDQTDFTAYGIPGEHGYKIEKAQGNFYLAQDGNYVLYFHSKVTGNVYLNPDNLSYIPGVEEITKELSSINQLKEIALPADYPALEVDLGLPLPPDTKLVSLDHYPPLRGGDIYNFKTSVSNDEFLLFYNNLAPANGWMVSQVGPIPELSYCSEGCATLKKGHAQIILYRLVSPFDGTIAIVGYYSK